MIKIINVFFILLFLLTLSYLGTRLHAQGMRPQINLKHNVSYDSDLGYAYITLQWDSPQGFSWYEDGNSFNISDNGYQVKEQELKSDLLANDGEEVIIKDIAAPTEMDSFNSGGISFEMKEGIGTIGRKFKYTVIAYDKSTAYYYDMNNQQSLESYAVAVGTVFVEIAPPGPYCEVVGSGSGGGTGGTTGATVSGFWDQVNLSLSSQFTDSTKPKTSTSTMTLADNSYRMYYTGSSGIMSATSTEGTSWQSPTASGVADIGATNPSVIKLKDGTYLMAYGVQTNQPTTESIFVATSTDGINFSKYTGNQTGGAVLVASSGEDNFVSVPDIIQHNDTTLRMYFVASTSSSYVHTAVSTDNGKTWTREGRISLTGTIGGQLNDPDVIKLTDGSYKLYFTTPPDNQSIGDLRIRSATSTDGRNFTVDSDVIAAPANTTNALMDPDVVLVPGTTDKYRLYYGANLTAGGPDILRSLITQ